MKSIIYKIFRHLSRIFHNNKSLTIVTGASESFYESLRDNLLHSIFKYENTATLIVWDLGLSAEQLNELELLLRDKGQIIHYPEENLSSHFSMKRHNYSFKSYCIYHSMCKCNTNYLLWLDAGCAIRKTLNAERNILKMYGFYSPYSSTSIGQLTYKDVKKYFFDNGYDYAKQQMLTGGVCGFDMKNHKIKSIVREWFLYTLNEQLISPVGADLTNHRFDQSLLSLIYYSHYSKVPFLARRLYDVRIHLNKK